MGSRTPIYVTFALILRFSSLRFVFFPREPSTKTAQHEEALPQKHYVKSEPFCFRHKMEVGCVGTGRYRQIGKLLLRALRGGGDAKVVVIQTPPFFPFAGRT